MGRFSNSANGAPAHVPQTFDLEVLRRRIKEVRCNHIRASGRLFDMCYSIQKTGELPDPEELSHALRLEIPDPALMTTRRCASYGGDS
jgi:hypothetical protein